MSHSSNTYVAIMAGGIGSRFWPGSRVSRPKQFLDIMGMGKSLLRLTYERFLALCPSDHIYIVTNKIYKDLVKEQLPELRDDQILCEPSRNNTAPCIAYTSFKIMATDPHANFVVAPSDHIILKEAVFIQKLKLALHFTNQNDALVTLGVEPSRPDTGYGYINFDKNGKNGIHKVLQFKEKPNVLTAQGYVDSGDYLWNAGIFIWKAKTIAAAFERYAKGIYDIFDSIRPHLNTPDEQAIIDKVYPTTPNISIDYAIMETADNVYTIPAEFGWSDLGTWNSLHVNYERDAEDNAVYSKEDVMLYQTADCLIRTPKGKLVIIKGLENFIVVDEPDVLLIHPKDREQEIKGITQALEKAGKEAYL